MTNYEFFLAQENRKKSFDFAQAWRSFQVCSLMITAILIGFSIHYMSAFMFAIVLFCESRCRHHNRIFIECENTLIYLSNENNCHFLKGSK